MAGLVPAIHVLLAAALKDVDARDICAKTRFALLPGHDGCFGRGEGEKGRSATPTTAGIKLDSAPLLIRLRHHFDLNESVEKPSLVGPLRT
jgi:hypothetical protein